MLKRLGIACHAVTFLLFWTATDPEMGEAAPGTMTFLLAGVVLGLLFLALDTIIQATRFGRTPAARRV